MTRLAFALPLLLAATTASAQTALPSPEACDAVRQRVQVALGQADRALRDDDFEQASLWTGVAADYSVIFDTFCQDAE